MSARLSRVAAAGALALAATACASGSDHHARRVATGTGDAVTAAEGPGGVQHVTIKTTNGFRFDPPTVMAHVGKLKVTLVDEGSYPHNLAIGARHFTSDTVTGDPGQNTTSFTLTFSKPGTYPFVCAFHSSAGMRGKFVIH